MYILTGDVKGIYFLLEIILFRVFVVVKSTSII